MNISVSVEQLQSRIEELEAENQELKQTCEDMQEDLEQAFGATNQKLLYAEMSSMELEQVFRACTDALWVIREDGVVVRANDAMLRILGKSSEEVIGKKCSKLLDYGHCDCKDCPLKTTSSSAPFMELDIRLPGENDKAEEYILTSAPLVTLDGSPGIVGQFKNITSRKEAEEALAKANAALERMARIDGLTQVANRRSFDERLLQEWRRLAREKKPFSLLLCDIDFFKRYNDTYGHQAGDDCLKKVAQALEKSILRPGDMVARYGGEEFGLILPGIDIEGALVVARRALEEVARLEVEHKASDVSPFVSISLGASCFNPPNEGSPEDLVGMADEALYQSKEQGRNRVTAATA